MKSPALEVSSFKKYRQRLCGVLLICLAVVPGVSGQESPEPEEAPAEQATAEPGQSEEANPAALREDLNLLGQAATDSGESRRNENVQFNAIDNNSIRELNLRLGVTATIVQELEPERGYFGSEFGAKPGGSVHTGGPAGAGGVHGSAFYRHTNSITTARSFFQVGSVQPARENEYGGDVTLPVWRGGRLSVNASAQDIRGNVNGNVLVPKADERTPLTLDPDRRAIVERFLGALEPYC